MQHDAIESISSIFRSNILAIETDRMKNASSDFKQRREMAKPQW